MSFFQCVNQGGSGGSSTLDGLSDVNLNTPSNGQVLKYNSTTQKWENANESGGGGGGSGVVDDLYTAQSTTPPSTINLLNATTNYDFLVIHLKSARAGQATIGYTYIVSALVTNDIIGGEVGSGNGYVWYYYTDSTTLTKLANSQGYYIDKICGVKI